MTTLYEYEIWEVLSRLEKEKDIRIIFAVENGARNWGLESVDSDFDVRFVFCRPIREYLRLNKPRDNLKLKMVGDKGEDVDLEGKDIYRFIELLKNSNPTVIEWLLSTIVYMDTECTNLINVCRKIASDGFSPVALYSHYRSMGYNNFAKYILRGNNVTYKRYLYAFRGLFNAIYVLKYNVLPNFDFVAALHEADFIDDTLKKIYLEEIIPAKKNGRGKIEIERMSDVDAALSSLFIEYPKKIDVDMERRMNLTGVMRRRVILPENIDDLIYEEVVI